MKQPTMAPFVSEQLIQHLVTSNPSAAYIQRVSSVFENNGSGVTGDLKAVITAILTDTEARSADYLTAAAPSATAGHLREPILFMANVLRGLNATTSATNTINNYANEMGENLFYAPSVFSYFSPQYRTEHGLLGPEFQIYSTQTVADRADIINTILYGKLDSTTVVSLTPFTDQTKTTAGLINYIASVFLYGTVPPAMEQAVTSAVNAATTTLTKVQAALYVVLTSSQYQIIQ